jgi:hypothetical protein
MIMILYGTRLDCCLSGQHSPITQPRLKPQDGVNGGVCMHELSPPAALLPGTQGSNTAIDVVAVGVIL